MAALGLMAAVLVGPDGINVRAAAQMVELTFDIPSQPMNAALAQFATESGVDILYDHKLAEGRQSVSVEGSFTPQIAITLLLRGSGLVPRFIRPKSALIFLESRPETAVGGRDKMRGPSLDLDPVRVHASPLVGSAYPARFESYGRATQLEIYYRLKSDPQMHGIVFRIKIRLKLDSAGRINGLSFIEGSGNLALDQHILTILEGTRLAFPPPTDLPQPLRFEIASR